MHYILLKLDVWFWRSSNICAMLLLSPLRKGCTDPSFDQTSMPNTQRCFVLSLVEIGFVVLEKIFKEP